VPAPCEAHPDIASIDSCRRCSAKLCAECRQLDGLTPYCASCRRAVRRAPWIRSGVFLLLAGAVGGGIFFVYQNHKPPFDYGTQTADVRKLEGQLRTEPCDRKLIVKLTALMRGAGDNRGTLEKIDAFEKACGAFSTLREIAYTAHEAVGEHEAAIGELNQLIQEQPDHPSRYAWRARIEQRVGNDAAAIKDFEKALALEPDLSDVPLELATLYDKSGRPCDALAPLDHLAEHYSEFPWSASVRVRIDELTKRGHCDGVTATVDRVSIATPPGKRDIRVAVKINGVDAGTFVVDTGATTVTTTTANAVNLGIELRGARKVRLQTANGEHQGLLVKARSVDVQGLSADRVELIVVDDLGPNVDGLLGMSYLSRFDIRKEDGRFEIRARGKAPAAASAAP
jgi:clan AA aspartic protease (TIGR02281 family)